MDIEEKIEEIEKELLNKELTLLEIDNKVINIIGDTNSLFEDESYCMEQNSCAYFVEIRDDIGVKNIIVEWEIIKKEDNNLDTVAKVVNVWED